MNGEFETNQPHQAESRRTLGKRDIIAAGMVALLAVGGYKAAEYAQELLEDPVDTQLLKPVNPEPDNMDSKLVVLNGNTQGRIRYKSYRKMLNKAVKEEQPDAMVLQETTARDPKLLQEEYPEANIHWMRADKIQEMSSGGFGNTIVVFRQKVEQLPSKSLPGKTPLDNITSTVAAGAKDIARGKTSMEDARQVMRENRVIGGVVMKAYNGIDAQDVSIMTTHIGGQKDVRTPQTDQAFDYIKEHSEDDRPSVVCGDFNNDPTNIIRRFVALGYYVDRTAATTDDKDHPIDFCAYKGIDVLGLANSKVLHKYKSDHYMLRVSFDVTPPQQDSNR